jgi:hypothetical protein
MIAGRKRRYRIIQEALDNREIGFKEVATVLGISYALVHRTARGQGNNRRILRYFLSLGIPAEDLDLPEDLRG